NMMRFRDDPENPARVIAVSRRQDEVGLAERELAGMQRDLASMLQQKNHLAALGLAVSKINHDLRNLLTSAQLFSEGLTSLPDPRVRVLLNLARNAVQALETRAANDPARDQVRITGRREGAVVVIEVSDTGPGFPARAREHLFEAFQSTARSGGTGLGLAIAA